MASENPYGAIVLDVMLPGFDGFEVCRRLRAAGILSPVLMLTARDDIGDRVRGLDVGADRLPGQAVQPVGAGGAPSAPWPGAMIALVLWPSLRAT